MTNTEHAMRVTQTGATFTSRAARVFGMALMIGACGAPGLQDDGDEGRDEADPEETDSVASAFVTTAKPIGYLDGATRDTAVGWACDANNFAHPLTIRLFDGPGFTKPLGKTVAAFPREVGVANACGGNPYHGFTAYYPPLSGDVEHKVYGYAVNVTATGAQSTPNTVLGPLTVPQAYLRIKNQFSGRCMDFGAPPALLSTCNGNLNQTKLRIRYSGYIYGFDNITGYRILIENSNLCVHASVNGYASIATCANTTAQLFNLEDVGPGVSRFRNRLNASTCLGDFNGRLGSTNCDTQVAKWDHKGL